jgi:hypothetical protein
VPIKPNIDILRQEFMNNGSNKSLQVTTPTPESEQGIVPVPGQYAQPAPFGSYKTQNVNYPKDVVQLDVYNDQDFFFETINDASSYRVSGDTVSIDVETELTGVGYESGDFRVAIRPLRHYLGSPEGIKLIIQDVSADRLEVRLVPSLITPVEGFVTTEEANRANAEFISHFGGRFFTLEKQVVLSNLFLSLSTTTGISINDYIQDRFTIRNNPYSIIFKLNEPLPVTTNVGSLVWVTQELNPPVVEPVMIIPRVRGRRLRYIKGPNFDVIRKQSAVTETSHRSWDDILSNPQTSAQTLRTIFTQSFVEGMQLNVDYRRFENFVKFSNAVDRIENFNYKVGLIENYYNLSSSISDTNASQSIYVQAQVQDALTKIDTVIGNFDGFERYMYFESSSYLTSSFGEFLDMAWPKATSTKPYQLYSITSSQVESWLEGIIGSASLHDNINAYSLRKNVPEHILQQQDNLVDSFVNMLGHFYDIQYEYINQIPKVYDRQESLTEGFAKELVYHIGESLGVNFGNGDDFEELWSYTLGVDTSGSFSNTNPLKLTGEDRTREVWKRVINNLPLLLRTKGTERGVRALINCFGIPSTILRIKEFGGPEMDFDRASQYRHDRFNYGTVVSGSSRIEVPYQALRQSSTFPEAVELMVRLAPTSSNTPVLQRLFRFGSVIVSAFSGSHIRFQSGASTTDFASSIYDGAPHHIAVQNDGSNLTCYVTRNNYGQPVTTSGSLSGVSMPTSNASVIIPTTAGERSSGMSGSVQELRYWTDPLSVRVLQAHAISPTSFFNDEAISRTGGTGSYTELGARFTFGSDNKKINHFLTSSVSSSHPNQSLSTFTGGTEIKASFINYANTTPSMIPWNETYYMEWPDVAGNRQISNKIRLESTIRTSEDLYPNKQTLTSLQDLQPTDSPRLGIYLSPTDEINQDIAEQFGGISLDDYIGAYEDIYNEDYPKLKHLKTFYFRKGQGRYKSQNYIRLLQYYNGSLFTLIKRLVPHRANLQTGLVIEPDILSRSKVRSIRKPQYEDEYYEGEIELPTKIDFVTGDIKLIKSDTDPFTTSVDNGIPITPDDNITATTLIVDPGEIKTVEEYQLTAVTQIIDPGSMTYVVETEGEGDLTWTGDTPIIVVGSGRLESSLSGSLPIRIVPRGEDLTLTGSISETRTIVTPIGEYIQLNSSEIDANVTSYYGDKTEGAQYEFYTWTGPVDDPTVYVGSGLVSNSADFIYVPAVDSAYSNPFGLTVYTNRRSKWISPDDYAYKPGGDILRREAMAQGRGWTSTSDITYSGSYGQYPIARLGVRLVQGGAGGPWRYSVTTNRLINQSLSGYLLIPLPYNEAPNAIYSLSFTPRLTPIAYVIQFGSGSAEYEFTGTATVDEPFTLQSKAANGLLYLQAGIGDNFESLKISILNFPGQFQDYMIGPQASLGQRNQKYNGCKLTAPDFNEDSPDTIDGGPVVTITQGPSTTLIVKPTIDGTYEFK